MKFFISLWAGFLLALTACEFNVSTANIENLEVCDQLDQDARCAGSLESFAPHAPAFIASCDLNNAPEGTSICFYWYFRGEQTQLIDSIVYKSEAGSSLHLHSNLNAPNNGWPIGTYEVIVSILTDNGNELRQQFQVSEGGSTSLKEGSPEGFGQISSQEEHSQLARTNPGIQSFLTCEAEPEFAFLETFSFSSRTPQFFAKASISGNLEGHSIAFTWYDFNEVGRQVRMQRDELALGNGADQHLFSELILDKPEWEPKEILEVEARIIASPLLTAHRFFYVTMDTLTQEERDFLQMAASVRGFFNWYAQNHTYLSQIDLVRYPASGDDLNDKGGLQPEGVDQLLETFATCPYLATTFTQIEADYLQKLEQIWQYSGSLSNQEDIPYGLDHDRILAETSLRAALTSEIQIKQHLGNQAYVSVANIPIRMLRQADQWVIESFEYSWQA